MKLYLAAMKVKKQDMKSHNFMAMFNISDKFKEKLKIRDTSTTKTENLNFLPK